MGQTGKDFLAVERAVSQPEDSLFIHENFVLLLNYLLRGCIFGLSGPLVSQKVWGGGGGPWPPWPPGSYAYVMHAVMQQTGLIGDSNRGFIFRYFIRITSEGS